jgi:hypothetical protein
LGCHTTFVVSLWTLWGFTFFVALKVRKDDLAWCCVRCYCGHCERFKISHFTKANPCPFAPCFVIFTPLGWHCAISQWCQHVSKCYHCWPHLSWFGFMDCFFSWGCYDSYGLRKGQFLSWLVTNRHVSPSSCKGFWVFTSMDRHIFSSMCQHGVGSEGHWKPSSFSFARFYRQRVSMALQCVQAVSILRHVIVIGEGASRLSILSEGRPLSLFDMLVVTTRGG